MTTVYGINSSPFYPKDCKESLGMQVAMPVANLASGLLIAYFAGAFKSEASTPEEKAKVTETAANTVAELTVQKNNLETKELPKWNKILDNPEEGMNKELVDAVKNSPHNIQKLTSDVSKADVAYNNAKTATVTAQSACDSAKNDFESAKKAYDAAKEGDTNKEQLLTAMNAAEEKLNKQKQTLTNAKQAEADAKKALETAQKNLKDVETKLKDAEKAYKENYEKRYNLAKEKVSSIEQQIKKLETQIAKAEKAEGKAIAAELKNAADSTPESDFKDAFDKNNNLVFSSSETDLNPIVDKAVYNFTKNDKDVNAAKQLVNAWKGIDGENGYTGKYKKYAQDAFVKAKALVDKQAKGAEK